MTLVPISRETHGKLRLRPITSFAFAETLPVIRVLAPEAAQAAANFPIVFIKENGASTPFALLGLAAGENLFVIDGQWQAQYVPALLRRYPFALGKGAGNDGAAQAVVMVDDSFLSEDEGEPLFGPEEGEHTGPVGRAVQMLTEIEVAAAQTARIVQSLVENGLLDVLPMQIARGGAAPVNMEGVHTIAEAKLMALPDEKFLELRRNGGLAFAFAQLLSLAQFPRLQALAAAKLSRAGVAQA